MNVAQKSYAARVQKAQDVLRGREPDILADIAHPGVAAAIWQRTPQPEFQDWLDNQPIENLPSLRVVTPLDAVEEVIQASCEQANMPTSKMRKRLVEDAAALAHMAGRALGISTVRIRFDIASQVMCPKFHQDAVPARLLCTYRGAGTEYVPEGQLSDVGRIRSVQTGSVALFRGTNWPSEEETGLLHRSPSLEEGGKTRLLFVVDPLEANL